MVGHPVPPAAKDAPAIRLALDRLLRRLRPLAGPGAGPCHRGDGLRRAGPDDRADRPGPARMAQAGLRRLDGAGLPDRLVGLAAHHGRPVLRALHADRARLPRHRPGPAPTDASDGRGDLLGPQARPVGPEALLPAVLTVTVVGAVAPALPVPPLWNPRTTSHERNPTQRV